MFINKEFYNYIVYDDGRVYSKFRKRFLNGSITSYGYLEYGLHINGELKRYRAHQLIAICFLENPYNYTCVNHIDGNKLNNHVSNLEWCTYYHNNKHARDNNLNNIAKTNSDRWLDEDFRRKTSQNISKGRKLSGSSKGENNPMFRYRVYMNGKVVTREQLKDILLISQSWCDVLIRRYANGEYVKLFDDNNIIVIDISKGQQTIEMVA